MRCFTFAQQLLEYNFPYYFNVIKMLSAYLRTFNLKKPTKPKIFPRIADTYTRYLESIFSVRGVLMMLFLLRVMLQKTE